MNSHHILKSYFGAGCFLFVTLAQVSSAQTARVESAPDFTPFLLDNPIEREDYNLRFGSLQVDISGTFGIEYDDNINTSEDNELEDLILQPGIDFGLQWELNEENQINLNVGAEYWYYISEDDLNQARNQLGLSPDTELSFRVAIGEFIFRIYDRIQYSFDSEDSIVFDPDSGEVLERDPDSFTRFLNVLGIQSEWFIRDDVFSAQITREDVYSPDDEFSFVNRFEHKILLNWQRALAANFTVGAGTSFAAFDFDDELNNDGDVFSIGPFVNWQLTEVVGLAIGTSYNNRDFDSGALTDTAAGSFGDDSQVEDFTWNVTLSHALNEGTDHQLEVYREVEVSDTANLDEVDGIRYSIGHDLTSVIRLNGALGYEVSESSGGLLNDDFDSWVAGVSTQMVLGPRITADLSYEYEDKDSDAVLESFDRNRLRILFTYDF